MVQQPLCWYDSKIIVKAGQEGMRTIDKYLVRRSVHTYDGSAKYKEGQERK